MVLKKTLFLLASSVSITVSAQEKDSATLISEVVIDAYRKPAKVIASTKSVAVATTNLQYQNMPDRLLESLNMLPGTRMEERSPGSYRLSVRGSTLRSPFGVRNIKVYLDDFILSDATGNTYLNIIDPELISRTEIYKGPESGDFGAVTGGTALLQTSDSKTKNFGIMAGSYDLFKAKAHYADQLGKHFLQVYQSYHTTDSYREQSAMKRHSLFVQDRWDYRNSHQLNLMLLYTDMHYETPGGLTLAQMQQNRRRARLATPTIPGAVQQQAGIYNKTLLAGVSHQFPITSDLSHFLVVQGAYTDLRNPFITNYEKRFENNFGFRTHFNYERNLTSWFLQTRLGMESGFNKGQVNNFDNNGGNPGLPQSADVISTTSGFVYFSQKADFRERLFLEGSVSLNSIKYDWQNIHPSTGSGHQKFENQWLPNFGASYLLGKGFAMRGKIGKGSSAPTSEEIRSSTQQINTALAPEYGWNKEIGLRKQFGNVLFVEGSYFDFRLKDAIVRRQNEAGQEYLVNAGGTVQKGIEILAETKNFQLNSKILNQLRWWVSGSFYNFTFEDYRKDNTDFTGNRITGVPATTIQALINLKILNVFYLDYSNYYTSETYLDDANTVVAESSLVGNLMLRYPLTIKNGQLNFHFQIQNLYDTEYVLGYDINAFGGRFYNPAAMRNFNMGISAVF